MVEDDYIMIDDYEDDEIKIKPCCAGEEYDVSQPVATEEGEEEIAYMFNMEKRYSYTYDMDNIHGYIKGKPYSIRFGHFIGEDCTNFIKTPFADEEDLVYKLYELYVYNWKIEKSREIYANKLFDFMIQLARARKCKFLQIEKHHNCYSYFYDYCRNTLKMKECEQYLYLEL